MSSATQESWDVQGGLQESLRQKTPDVSGEESGESPWSILHTESQLPGTEERERLPISLLHSWEGGASEVSGGHKARGKPPLESDAVAFYLEKHRFSPRLKKSLEKAVTPAPEEASGCYLEWLEPPRVASKQL